LLSYGTKIPAANELLQMAFELSRVIYGIQARKAGKKMSKGGTGQGRRARRGHAHASSSAGHSSRRQRPSGGRDLLQRSRAARVSSVPATTSCAQASSALENLHGCRGLLSRDRHSRIQATQRHIKVLFFLDHGCWYVLPRFQIIVRLIF
jgi:hypothetical protein